MQVHVGKLWGREELVSEGRVVLGAGLCCPCAVSEWGLLGEHLPPELLYFFMVPFRGHPGQEDMPLDVCREWFQSFRK